MILRIKLREGNTEFWKYLFRGEWLSKSYAHQSKLIDLESIDVVYDNDVVDDLSKLTEDDEPEDDEAQDEEEEVEQNDKFILQLFSW